MSNSRYLLVVLMATFGACASMGGPASLPGPSNRYDGPVIDIHAHVFFDGESGALTGLDGSPEGVLAVAQAPRLAKMGVIVMARHPGIEATRRLNDQLVAFVARAPTQLFGIGTVHPADGAEAITELGRIRRLGIRMLKLHPNTQHFDVASPEVAAIVAAAAELGMPVLFDFSGLFQASDFDKYLMLAVTHPSAKLILAHMGGTKFHGLLVLKALRNHGTYTNNLWVDLSGVAHLYAHSPYRDQLLYVIREVGVDRVLFGSDFPFDRTPSDATNDVHALGLTESEERLILHDNAVSLLASQQGVQ